MSKDTDDLIREFMAETGEDAEEWRPSWNVAPTDPVAVVREHKGRRSIQTVRWGIVAPSAPVFGVGKPIINARIETVASNGLFRRGFTTHRCLVPATGYYEWQMQEHGKQPYFISEPGVDLAMAGVIQAWPDRSKAADDPSRWRLSMAVITRDAHVAPGEVHDRMPACLTPDSYGDWLGDHLGAEELLALLDRDSLDVAHQLSYVPVSKTVNSVKNNGPELIEPL